MIISESKLRKIISKVLKESIFGLDDRDPAAFPGEKVLPEKNTFFGYNVENKTNFIFKRREILAYATEYFLELMQLKSGMQLNKEERNRLDEFRKNFVGLIIEMHINNDKYPKYKIDETINFIRISINKVKRLSIKEFLSLLLSKDIVDEILQLEKHLIPKVFLLHIRNNKEYLEVADDVNIETIADYYPGDERTKKSIRQRSLTNQRTQTDERFPDFIRYYDEGNINDAYQVLENIMKNLLTKSKSFASKRATLLNNLSKKLGFVVKEEIRERRKGERLSKYNEEVERIKKINKKNNLAALKKARVWLTDNLSDQELVREFLSRKY